MAHISTIGAGLYSDLSVGTAVAPEASLYEVYSSTDWFALFDNTPGPEFERIRNVREFPAMGTPPNIVNVPVYGSKTSQQIQGQADAPNIEISLNYVASEWADGSTLGDMVGDGISRVFRFSLMNNEPAGYTSNPAGLGTTDNSQYFWIGKIEALQVQPQLNDSNTATVTISVQSEFFGAYTNDV